MTGRVRGLLRSPVAVLTVLAFYIFAGWQIASHLYLMRVSMLSYHLVSLIVETAAAGVVAFFVIRALVRKNRELEELDRQKDMLTSTLVHDLRQPLTAVIGGLEGVHDNPDLPQDTKALIDIAYRGGTELLDMVNDLLDVTRLEADHPVIQLQLVTPADFISGGVEALQQLAHNHDIEIRIDWPQDVPPVYGDPERLRRVVANLVGNSLKVTPSGGEVSVSARTDDHRPRLLVSVSDTGPGVPKGFEQRIFDKFATVGNSRPSSGRASTGLGLTFCKMIVEAHGGEIWVESKLGRGATFTFSIPTAKRAD